MRLQLEALEDRTLLSVSAGNPQTILPLDSPQPASSVAAIASYVRSTLDQWGHLVATVQQDVTGLWKALGQEIAQGVSFVEQQWARLLGFNPSAQYSTNTAMLGAGSESGAGNVQGKSADSGNPSRTAQSPSSTAVIPHAPSPSSRMTPLTSGSRDDAQPFVHVYLSSSSYTVDENAGSVTLEVDLNTASTNTVSVELTTSDGTATSGIDYSSVDTEVVFQPGTTSQTVNIPIIDDGASDDSVGSESFSVQLSNAINAQIVSPSTATVAIQENSSPPPPPPPQPGGVVYGTVWLDNDDDGIMQAGEPGLDSVEVDLWSFSGGTEYLFSAGTTDGNGQYLFPIPSDATGLQFVIEVVILPGYYATIEDAGSTGIVSDIDAEGYSPYFMLNANGGAEIDAGLTTVPPQGPIDTLVWNPGSDNNASTVTNWYDQTIWRQLRPNDPGPGPGTPIIFDGTPNNQTPYDDSPITWDDPVLPSMTLQNGYNQLQTINPGVTIELTGAQGTSLSMDGTSWLKLAFLDAKSTFQIDNNATITNMTLIAYTNGQGLFKIKGGITTIEQSPGYFEKSEGVPIDVAQGATLNDQSYGTLALTADNTTISVEGRMLVYWGTGSGNLLIQGNDYITNDDINVNGGVLGYYGKQNVTDTFSVPITVQNGGTFQLSVGNNDAPLKGTLIVDGANALTHNVSVYLTGASSSVQLSNGDTLECDNGYYEDSGTLKTTDNTGCTLKIGADDDGTATVAAGGVVWIASTQNTYGALTVDGDMIFDGELEVSIQGYFPTGNPGISDLLSVSGTLYLNTDTSTLYVFDYLQLQKKDDVTTDFWSVIGPPGSMIEGNFSSESSDPQANLSYEVNTPKDGQYRIEFNG